MSITKDFEWSDLYLHWNTLFLNKGWKEKVSFTPILVTSPPGGLRIGTEICDWWPTNEISERQTSLEKDGTFGVNWESKKGTIHTAQLLYQCQDDPETQASILIAASAWDKLKPLPKAWRGDIFQLATDILNLITFDASSPFCKREFPRWHHAMREALPVNIATEEFARFSTPKKYQDLVYLAFLEATLSTSLWAPVIVSHAEPN